ncbi:hypothetical protein BKA70DRAFT_1394675 [Coprinopsis sp. MPI-PUGE-AT-0042]|nr:hypothetical protein BKA70DRAFT_1394675 [Coprinopsis sp. MPI-PUGE-AT-0042]
MTAGSKFGIRVFAWPGRLMGCSNSCLMSAGRGQPLIPPSFKYIHSEKCRNCATVPFRAFAIPLTPEGIEDLIDRRFPDHIDLLTEENMVVFRSTNTKTLPEGIVSRLAKMPMPIKRRGSYPCIVVVVIATNMIEEGRGRANMDPQVIKKLHDDLGVTNLSGWFCVINKFNEI